MYNLYHSKEEKVIKLEKVNSKTRQLFTEYDDTLKEYNDNYFVSTDRGKLKAKAIEIKDRWIKEAEEELKKMKAIKIQ